MGQSEADQPAPQASRRTRSFRPGTRRYVNPPAEQPVTDPFVAMLGAAAVVGSATEETQPQTETTAATPAAELATEPVEPVTETTDTSDNAGTFDDSSAE